MTGSATRAALQRGDESAAPQRAPRRGELAGAVIVSLVVIALTLPAVVAVGLLTDTGAHLRFAASTAVTGREWGPYSLFEQLVIIVRALAPWGAMSEIWPALGERQNIWDISGVLVLLGFAVFLSQVLYRRFLSTASPLAGFAAPAVAGVLAVVASVVTPVTVFTWGRHQLHDGYIRMASYENPTINLLRPLALVLFWVLVDRMPGRSSGRVVAATAVLTLVALHAKPSYAVCLLPAIVAVGLWRRYKGLDVDVRLWGLGFVLPTALGLAYQALAFRGEGGVGWAPFEILSGILEARGLSTWHFVPLVAMSALFPIVVAIALRSEVRRSPSLALGWLAFAVGIAVVCLLKVTDRRDYGDLLWGPQVALFVVFVESMVLLVRRIIDAPLEGRRRVDLASTVALVALALHVVSGAVLWYHETFNPAEWW